MMKSNDTINHQATYWIACEKEGLNDFEKQEFKKWLNENPEHEDIFNEAKNTQNIFRNLSKSTAEELSFEANKGAKQTKVIQKFKPIGFAAIFLLVLFVGILKINDYTNPSYSHIYITNNQILNNINLPDGSIISLDAKAQINVNFYSDKREIDLISGKAMFSIAKNSNRPFFITSGRTQIKVIGTRFEVIKNKTNSSIKVEEGKVQVSYIQSNHKIKNVINLTKGEVISLTDVGKINYYGKVNLDSIAIWRKKLIIFNQNTLEDAFIEFSKYTNFKINYNSNDIKNLTITGKFLIDEFDIFLKNLPKIYPVVIENKNNIIEISNNK